MVAIIFQIRFPIRIEFYRQRQRNALRLSPVGRTLQTKPKSFDYLFYRLATAVRYRRARGGFDIAGFSSVYYHCHRSIT